MLLMGMQIGAASGQNRMDDSPKRELTYDALIPLLGAYSDEGLIQKDTCTPPNVQRSLIYNSQDTETSEICTER